MRSVSTFIFGILFVHFLSAQNALNFDGIDDVVQTTYPGITGNSARTVEAWINTTANSDPGNGGTQNVITDWGSTATGGRFTFCVLWSNAIRLEVAGNGLSGTIPVNDGNWHHVAVVWDPIAVNPVTLYVDGVVDVAGSLTVSVNTGSTTQMRIGQRIDAAKQFEGTIDEVRVWNSVKTEPELQANMNNELCNFTADLQAYYTFNQGTADGTNTTVTTLFDQSGNSYNGTLSSLALNGTSSNWVNGASLSSGFTTSYTSLTACNQYTWSANNMTYTTAGVYSAVLTGVSGCDSIATLDLSISSPNNLTNNVTTCDSYTWSVNNVTYTSDATVDSTLENAYGCQYHHYLNLIVLNSSMGTDVITSCDPITWIDGNTYSASTNTPTWTLTNSVGCDSIVTLDLTMNTVDPSVTNTNLTLSANSSGLQYQWVDCNDNYNWINGETNQSFTPDQNGSYAVIVTGNACSDTSDCQTIATIGLDELGLPFKGRTLLKITDLMGRETNPTSNTPLLYIYSDGTIERVFLIK